VLKMSRIIDSARCMIFLQWSGRQYATPVRLTAFRRCHRLLGRRGHGQQGADVMSLLTAGHLLDQASEVGSVNKQLRIPILQQGFP
jgi:hypothetical protein